MISSFFLSRGESSPLKQYPKKACLFTIPLYGIILILFFSNQCHASLSLTGKLNINDATTEELLLLPHISYSTAEAISDHIDRMGNFKDFKSLASVKGLPDKTLEGILPFLRLTGESTLTIINDNLKVIAPPLTSESSEIILLSNRNYLDLLLKAVNKAQSEIVISMFLFKTYKYQSSATNRLMNALILAAKRGVDVVVFLEEGKGRNAGVTETNKDTAKRLLRGGVKVLFDDPKRTTHTKVVVVDKSDIFLGSHNLTSSALQYNNELSIYVKSRDLAGKVLAYIRDIMKQ